MARFVTNMERSVCNNRFKDKNQVLFCENYSNLEPHQIEEGVKQSFTALKDLLSSNTIEMER